MAYDAKDKFKYVVMKRGKTEIVIDKLINIFSDKILDSMDYISMISNVDEMNYAFSSYYDDAMSYKDLLLTFIGYSPSNTYDLLDVKDLVGELMQRMLQLYRKQMNVRIIISLLKDGFSPILKSEVDMEEHMSDISDMFIFQSKNNI